MLATLNMYHDRAQHADSFLSCDDSRILSSDLTASLFKKEGRIKHEHIAETAPVSVTKMSTCAHNSRSVELLEMKPILLFDANNERKRFPKAAFVNEQRFDNQMQQEQPKAGVVNDKLQSNHTCKLDAGLFKHGNSTRNLPLQPHAANGNVECTTDTSMSNDDLDESIKYNSTETYYVSNNISTSLTAEQVATLVKYNFFYL